MRTTNRLLIIAAITAVFVATLALPAMAGPAGEFISRINSSRSAAGLAPLSSHSDLADDARAHSNLMADRQELFHSNNLGSVTSGWDKLGENVGVNVDVSGMHSAFMNSSGHRGNILGDYNYVGVGVTVDESGFMWATIIFMKKGSTESTTTTTQPPSTTTTTQPPSTTTTSPPPASSAPAQPPASNDSASSAQKAQVRNVVVSDVTKPERVPHGHARVPAYAI